MDLDKEKQHGLFWLPSNPEEKVNGAITLDDEYGTILTAYGQLGLFNESEEQQAIHGVFASGYIKLVNCLLINQSMNAGKFAAAEETKWRCHFAFRGDEYCGDVPNRIKSVEADIESLGDWTPGFEGIQLAKDRLSLSWPASQPDQAATWDLGVVTVRQHIRSSLNFSRHAAVESATVRASTSVCISFDEPQSWRSVMRTVLDLQALLSIAKGEAVHVERTSIVEEGAPDARLIASYRPVLRRDTRQIRHSELFTMQELGGIEGIARWLNVLDDRESLITALLVDRYRQPAFITDRTSHLLIACEAYQRHLMADPGKRIYNLRKEVLDPMLYKAGRPFEEWVGKSEDWKKKVNEIRNNYGVGHLQGYAGRSSASPDFHLINEQLYLLVVSCLLSECGVSEDTRREVVKRMRSDWKIRL